MIGNVIQAQTLAAWKSGNRLQASLEHEAVKRLLREVMEVLGLELHPFGSHEPCRPGVQAGGSHDHDATGPEHFIDLAKKLPRIGDVLDHIGNHAHIVVVLFRYAIDTSADDPAAAAESVHEPGACVFGILHAGHIVTKLGGSSQ